MPFNLAFLSKMFILSGKLRALQSQQPVPGRVKWQTAEGTTCAANSSHRTPRTTHLIATFHRICVNLGRGVAWRKVGRDLVLGQVSSKSDSYGGNL